MRNNISIHSVSSISINSGYEGNYVINEGNTDSGNIYRKR
jgi:hypothetical protein